MAPFILLAATTRAGVVSADLLPRGVKHFATSMMFMGMAPFGAFFGGALAHRIGAPITVAIGGATCVVGAILFGRALPTMRIEARRLIVAQGLAGGEPEQELNAQPVEE